MPIINFYHPKDKRLIAKIKAIDSTEAKKRFVESVNEGYEFNPSFMGTTPEAELEYLCFNWDIIEEGLPNGEYDWKQQDT